MADRIGRQTPTESFVLPYQKTDGAEAIAVTGNPGEKQWTGRNCWSMTFWRGKRITSGHI